MEKASGVTISADLHPVVKKLLVSRGYTRVTDLDDFLHPAYEKLHDPFLMKDMDLAVERILMAIERGEEVVVYGDYDIDGITASALVIEVIGKLGGKATSYIPDRFEEGYGLNLDALQDLHHRGTRLVVTVDCGITSVREIDWANSHGLDIVITDHHTVPEVIPKALAVVNPKQPGDKYPFKELAGVGVAFKLAQALQMRSGDRLAVGQEKWLLDLVALGTVCDVVPLVGENRILVSWGLKVMRKTRRLGLRALASAGGVDVGALNSYHLGFVLGPRLNASGRLEHASKSLRLMMATDSEKADEIAAELNDLNQRRLGEQAVVLAAADEMARQYEDNQVLVLAKEDWSHGLVGIVASRLVEKWRKPTLVIQILGESAKGSARSVGGFDIVKALRVFEHHFTRLGGHYFAAGFTIKTKKIVQLRKDLNNYCREQGLSWPESDKLKEPELELSNLQELDWRLWDSLQNLEPFGNANPRPIFATSVWIEAVRLVGKQMSHLKLTVKDDLGKQVQAVAFNAASDNANLGPGMRVRMNYQINRNEYLGKASLELLVTDLDYEQK